jgi:hypothetical protein
VDAGHPHVAEHEVDGLCGDDGHRLAGVARARNPMADPGEDSLERPAVELLVVDDEDVGVPQTASP